MKKIFVTMMIMALATVAVSAKESKYTAEEKAAVMSVYYEKSQTFIKARNAYFDKDFSKDSTKVIVSNKKAYSEYKKAYDTYVEASKKYKEALEEYRNSNKNVTAYRKFKVAKDSYKFCKNNLTRKEKTLKKTQNKLDKSLDKGKELKNKYDETKKALEIFIEEHEDIINEYYEEKFGIVPCLML